jgi:hypothetical protein
MRTVTTIAAAGLAAPMLFGAVREGYVARSGVAHADACQEQEAC